MYTTNQKIYWLLLVIAVSTFTFFWIITFRQIVKSDGGLIDLTSEIASLVVIQGFVCALFHAGGVRIVRTGDFKRRNLPASGDYPNQADKWNTVQTGVFWVTILLICLPPIIGMIFR